jgi:hypothetical protein
MKCTNLRAISFLVDNVDTDRVQDVKGSKLIFLPPRELYSFKTEVITYNH